MSETNLSDEQLVVAAQQGDRTAWAQLCQRHAPRLTAYLGGRLRRPAVVDKLVSEVIAGAWKHLGEIQQPGDFPAWFRRVGGNLALQWFRSHAQESLAESFPSERCGGDPVQTQRMERLEAALYQLSDAQRLALEQYVRGGMDLPALGEALHLDQPAVEHLLEEAMCALEALLARTQP